MAFVLIYHDCQASFEVMLEHEGQEALENAIGAEL